VTHKLSDRKNHLIGSEALNTRKCNSIEAITARPAAGENPACREEEVDFLPNQFQSELHLP
jgi:hypothetical protein